MTLTPRTTRALSVLESYCRMHPQECATGDLTLQEVAHQVVHFSDKHSDGKGGSLAPFADRVERIIVDGQEEFMIREREKIGEGFSKNVYRGVLSTAKKVTRLIAVSEIKPNKKSPFDAQWDKNELEFLKRALDVPVHGSIPVIAVKEISDSSTSSGTQFLAVFPLCDADLLEIFTVPKLIRKLEPRTIRVIQEKLIKSVVLFHEKYIHRDVKLENFLFKITPPEEFKGLSKLTHEVLNHPETVFEVFLGDVAFTQGKNVSNPMSKQPGTPSYMAPEIAHIYLENSKRNRSGLSEELLCIDASEKMDVWSLGLCLLALEYGPLYSKIIQHHVKDSKNVLQVYAQYYCDNSIPCFPEPEIKESMRHIIWEMLRPRPEERLTIKDVLEKFKNLEQEGAIELPLQRHP